MPEIKEWRLLKSGENETEKILDFPTLNNFLNLPTQSQLPTWLHFLPPIPPAPLKFPIQIPRACPLSPLN
jgi:hypothetical protein